MNQNNYETIKINLKILFVMQLLQILLFASTLLMIYLNYNLMLIFFFILLYIYTHYEMNNIRKDLFENG